MYTLSIILTRNLLAIWKSGVRVGRGQKLTADVEVFITRRLRIILSPLITTRQIRITPI